MQGLSAISVRTWIIKVVDDRKARLYILLQLRLLRLCQGPVPLK